MQTNPPTSLIRKITITIAVILALIVLGLIVRQALGNRDANVELISVPADAQFEIKGRTYKAGKITLPTGNQTIVAKREGFADATQRIEVTNKLQQVQFALTPESGEAKEWAAKNSQKYTDIEAQAGQQAQQQGEEFRIKNPIITILPYQGVLFTINYRVSRQDPNTVILQIAANNSANRSHALDYIDRSGYDVTNYPVEFSDYNNPLGGGND